MPHELKKQSAIEPEIINEYGENITRRRTSKSSTAAAGLLAVITLMIFAVITVIIAVPMLILNLLGRKPNIKIFKFKL